jgi:antitoxin VapB
MINLSLETEALARRLAEAQSISVEDAVRQALEARARIAGLAPEPPRRNLSAGAIAARRARIDETVRAIAALPILDRRSPNEIMDDLNAI